MEEKKGIDRSRIVSNEIDEALLCKICLEVLDDPVECADCNSAYCRECINAWKQKNDSCPNRCEKLVLQKPHKLLFDMLRSLQVTCENKDLGCQYVGKIEQIDDHLKECPYRVIKCANEKNGCLFKGFPKEIEDHQAECEYFIIKCDKGCEQNMFRKDWPSHSCIAELQGILSSELKKLSILRTKASKMKQIMEFLPLRARGVTCCACKEENIEGPSYTCLACEKYNLCEVCYKQKKHPHKMIKMPILLFESEVLDVQKWRGEGRMHFRCRIKVSNPEGFDVNLRFISEIEDKIEYSNSEYFKISPRSHIIKNLDFSIPSSLTSPIKFYFHGLNRFHGIPFHILP